MTNRAPIALMAAALFLVVQGQPRSAQAVTLSDLLKTEQGQPRSDQPPRLSAEASDAVCPCGDPRKLIPNLDHWLGSVKCVGTEEFAGGVQLVSQSVGNNMDLGLFSHSVDFRGELSCLYFEDGGVAGKGQSGISEAQSVACSRLIIDYAQKLNDVVPDKIADFGCNLN